MCKNIFSVALKCRKITALTLAIAAILLFSVIHSPPTAHAQLSGSFFETALRDVTNAAASVYVPAEVIITNVSRFFEQTANHITNTAASFRDFITRMFGATPPPPPAPTPTENIGERFVPREMPPPPLPPSPLPPPAQAPEEGATPSAAAERRHNRETFIVNTNLRVAGDTEIRGDIDVAGGLSVAEQLRAMNVFVSGGTDTNTLTVRDASETRGLLRALGGIRTGGADIDLEGGRILGFEYVRSIEAGDNILITGEDGNLTISAINNNVGVLSLNDLTGNVSLVGLPNQIEVTPTGRTLRLSLPQDIGATSSPVFAGLTVTGNMGVGLTSPTSRLHLRGGDLRVDDAANNPTLFVQQSTGNVGIGTIAPTVRLDIDGQIRIRGGSPATGRLLIAGADGTATWKSLLEGASFLQEL